MLFKSLKKWKTKQKNVYRNICFSVRPSSLVLYHIFTFVQNKYLFTDIFVINLPNLFCTFFQNFFWNVNNTIFFNFWITQISNNTKMQNSEWELEIPNSSEDRHRNNKRQLFAISGKMVMCPASPVYEQDALFRGFFFLTDRWQRREGRGHWSRS